MMNNFDLTVSQLLDIANDLKEKIGAGLKNDGTEIKALPTFIHPKKHGISGDAVAFDLGGTNFRAAAVSIGQSTTIKDIAEKDITEMRADGFSQNDLYHSQWETIHKLNISKGLPVGYCFSYPAKSLINGDAELIEWSKGIHIADMKGSVVGKPLMDYLNQKADFNFKKITVVNDTITSLFAGLMNPGFDAYVGLIVGTGTNMATFFPSESIPKLNELKNWTGETPVNLETGNFFPPHLTAVDDKVDRDSDLPGAQRFEKAVSGMYLGRVFRAAVPEGNFKEDFDGASLTYMIRHPGEFKKEYVEVAYQVYERSAKLIAASIAGLIKSLHEVNPSIQRIQILAEGSLFWSTLNEGQRCYSEIVTACLDELIHEYGFGKKEVVISKVKNANLIGAAIAVLS